MNQDNRVLCRTGARELTPHEIDQVTGAVRTLTLCTITYDRVLDGDVSLGEC